MKPRSDQAYHVDAFWVIICSKIYFKSGGATRAKTGNDVSEFTHSNWIT